MASIKGLSGASLDIWKDYFPNATIHGIDIADHHHLSSGRVQVFQADQSKPEELEMIMEQSGGHYDIIIDDGSHASLHQQISFSVLFKHLKPRGMYIIEDLKIHPPFERSHLKADAQLQKTEHVCTEFLDQGRLNLAGAQDLASDALVDSIDQCTLHMETGGGIVRFTKK